MPPTIRVSILHGPRSPLYVLPDGRHTSDFTVSANFAFAAVDLLAELDRHPTQALIDLLRAATGPTLDVTADWKIDVLVAPLITARRYEHVRCAACDAGYAPADVTTRSYRNEHGTWGVNAGVEFYCPNGHRLYDRKDEQTA